MPVMGWGHTQYWNGSVTIVVPPTPTVRQYPAWQAATITLISLLLVLVS